MHIPANVLWKGEDLISLQLRSCVYSALHPSVINRLLFNTVVLPSNVGMIVLININIVITYFIRFYFRKMVHILFPKLFWPKIVLEIREKVLKFKAEG